MDNMLKGRIEAVLALINQPIQSIQDMPEDGAAFSAPEWQRLVQAGYGQPSSVLDEAVRSLIVGIDVPNLYHASLVAQIAGAFVEFGADAEIALETVLNRLEPQLVAARRFVDQFGEKPADLSLAYTESADDCTAWRGVPYMGLAAMTMLARSVSGRQKAHQRTALCGAAAGLEGAIRVCFYLSKVLALVDDLKVLILDVENRQGWWVRVTGIQNNFHFFTLLQCALGISRGEPDLCAVAQGEVEMTSSMTDGAVRSYLSWLALTPDNKVIPFGLIWGEITPADIPQLDGVPIVIMGSGGPQRYWDADMFAPLHDALRSSVTVEETLDSSEVDRWLERIRSAPRI
jgi:hypothetical protein